MNIELVGVVRSTRHAVVPCAAAIDRGHERAGLDRDPESTWFERVARDPADVMRVRSRGKDHNGDEDNVSSRLVPSHVAPASA